VEAFEILKSERYDLLFMDTRMPGIDGLKATQFIRNEMKIMESDMPVICISAASINEDWQKYQKAGMNAFLPKPFTEQTLITTILSVVKDYGPVTRVNQKDEERIISSTTDKISLKNLYHISGGDEQFVKQMLVSFIESTENGLSEMREALGSGLLETVGELAHKMLPPCRHIGASELSFLLKKVEENIRQKGEKETLVTLTGKTFTEFDAVRELVKIEIEKII
jgi:YesN/AraC family two-component response regulator